MPLLQQQGILLFGKSFSNKRLVNKNLFNRTLLDKSLVVVVAAGAGPLHYSRAGSLRVCSPLFFLQTVAFAASLC